MNREGLSPRVRIAAMIEYVRSHVEEGLNIELLAERAGFSPFHFQRVFRLAVGQTIGEYIRTKRLRRAAVRLRETEIPVTAIALESGYDTPSAFSRAFISSYGCTPTAFRGSADVHDLGDDMEIRIERMPRLRFLGMRHVGPYSQVPKLWKQFNAHIAARGLQCANALHAGLSYDDPESVELEALRYDACVASNAEPDEALSEIVVESGRWALYRHTGPYELIGYCFDRLIDKLVFINEVRLRDAPFMELDPHPDRTDLAVPIM